MVPLDNTASRTSRGPGGRAARLLCATLCLLPPVVGAAAEACHAQFKVGAWVWYATLPLDRVTKTIASGCTVETGPAPEVLFFVKGAGEIIFCDQALVLPPAMKSELDAAQLEGVTVLPSRRSSLDATWQELVGKYSPSLRCGPGFRRMSDASSGVPSVFCRRQLTRRELCPSGSTFGAGVCSSLACPAGTVDLDHLTGGRLSGCSRCPAGQLDVEESLAWRGQSSWASASGGPVFAVLCKAQATAPCPARRSAGSLREDALAAEEPPGSSARPRPPPRGR